MRLIVYGSFQRGVLLFRDPTNGFWRGGGGGVEIPTPKPKSP